jgi:hypothetical protein
MADINGHTPVLKSLGIRKRSPLDSTGTLPVLFFPLAVADAARVFAARTLGVPIGAGLEFDGGLSAIRSFFSEHVRAANGIVCSDMNGRVEK